MNCFSVLVTTPRLIGTKKMREVLKSFLITFVLASVFGLFMYLLAWYPFIAAGLLLVGLFCLLWAAVHELLWLER